MFLVAGTSDEALLSLFSSWLCSSLELRSLDDELDELLSSLELRLLDEELDKDDEDEDFFENLQEWSSIDPSAIVNSVLGTDLERSGVSPWACMESLADLLDGFLAPPIVFFWLLEEISSFPFCGLHFLSFVHTSQLVAWLRSKPLSTRSLAGRP